MPQKQPRIFRWLKTHPNVRKMTLHPQDPNVVIIAPTNRTAKDSPTLQTSLKDQFGINSRLTFGPHQLRIEVQGNSREARELADTLKAREEREKLLRQTRETLALWRKHADPKVIRSIYTYLRICLKE